MMSLRYSKIVIVAALAFYAMLVGFGNLADYNTNFPLVKQTMMMKDLLKGSTIGYRAVENPILHHVAYDLIIVCESLTGIFCAVGAFILFRERKTPAERFNHSKKWAVIGLTLGFLTWQVLFRTIAGEWFAIWMSPMLGAASSEAFRLVMTFLVVLVYVGMKDD